MSSLGLQQDLEKCALQRDGKDPEKDHIEPKEQKNIRVANVKEQLALLPPRWQGDKKVPKRSFGLRHSYLRSASPFVLFWAFFQPVVDLIIKFTNIHAHRKPIAGQVWHDVTVIDIRRWIAVRLYLMSDAAKNSPMRAIWARKHPVTQALARDRFLIIESHLSVYDPDIDPEYRDEWFLKVLDALNMFRRALRSHLSPGSQLTVDESTIKFSGRMKEKFKLAHKPAGEGFVVYALCSWRGLMHDFIVAGSQSGLEGVQEPLRCDIAVRSTRKRKRVEEGERATTVILPPTKAAVFELCERVTRWYNDQPFACYIDNLFTDIPLTKALKSINIGSCGTVRLNAPGFPPILNAIKRRFPKYMALDQVSSIIVDNIANCTIWKDAPRRKIVALMSTMHRPAEMKYAVRRIPEGISTRSSENAYAEGKVKQPAIAVDYNSYMGNTDLANRLRAFRTIRRGRQHRWTTKWIEFMVDVAHCNAFIVWREDQQKSRRNTTTRDHFIEILTMELILVQEKVHTPSKLEKRTFCQYSRCHGLPLKVRKALAEVDGNASKSRNSQTSDHCPDCRKHLCVGKGCWSRYHRELGIEVLPEHDIQDEE